jgi:acetyltransferase-like isoleucine patch superfamily enzyme
MRRSVDRLQFRIFLLIARCRGIDWVVRYLRNPNPRFTVRLLQAFGATIGARTKFKRSVMIDNAFEDKDSAGDFSHLKIGENCYIGDGVYFDLAGRVELENDVVIAGRASFVTHADCNRSAELAECFPRVCAPVKIEQGAWIGFGATVLAGVTVGARSVVAAHCLLKDDAEPASIYAGVPGKLKSRIDLKKDVAASNAIGG